MSEANRSAVERSPVDDVLQPRSIGPITGLLPLLFIVLSTSWVIYRQLPPAAVDANAPAKEFSSGRALSHIQAISQKPHPMGSTENKRVRDYIFNQLTNLGLSPEVQRSNVISNRSKPLLLAGTVNNVVARIKGTGNGQAILLVGHYDSEPTSLGASDDGSAVAILLETIRALKSTALLQNDLIFLFTDGEESGLLGAKAFVDQNPWAKDVRLVLNFEARGTKGPSLMFETSKANGWLIKQFAEAVPRPVASSFFYEVYKLLPNDTDLSVFKEAGYPGLNFAYVDGLPHYHTLSDSVTNLDQRSLQHQGSYALALARWTGNVNLDNTKKPDAIYFNLPGSSLVHYAEAWVLPLSAVVLLLLIGIIVLGIKRQRLTAAGLAMGFLAQLATIIFTAIAVTLVIMMVRAVHSDYRLIVQGTPYNNQYYILGFSLLTVSIASGLYTWFSKKLRVLHLIFGGLLCWAILLVLTSSLMPGASYLFTWPLLFSLIALGVLFISKWEADLSIKQMALLYAGAIPGIVLLSPIIYLAAVGLPLNMFRLIVLFVVLQVALLIPLIRIISTLNRWLLPGLTAFAALIFLVMGSLSAGFNKNDPKPDNIFYALNADTGKAVWASFDRQPDEWTSQFFPPDTQKGAITEYAPLDYSGYLNHAAPAAPLAAPQITLLSDQRNDAVRILHLQISSPRQAPFLYVSTDPDVEIVGIELNGQRVDSSSLPPNDGHKRRWGMFYYAPPAEGVGLTLELKTSFPFKIRVMDQSYELPESLANTFKARPDYIVPTPYPYNSYSDATLVSKTFIF